MKDPEEKKGHKPEEKPGVTPGGKERESYRPEGPGTIVEVAPDARRSGGPIKEMAPDVSRVRPEIAPDVRSGKPIQEMAPHVSGVRPEVAPDVRSGRSGPIIHPMYAVTIQKTIAEGDLQQMRDVASEAEQQLNSWGDLRTSLEILKVEIAKLERKQTKG